MLTAKSGIFRQAKKTLDLTGAVNLFHDSGYEFKTSKAVIDLQKGVASGSEAVRGHGPFGEMQGEGFRLFDKGKTIIFTGKSKLVIFPGLGKSAK
jgi:lipopolysaccharide export system protein LptC